MSKYNPRTPATFAPSEFAANQARENVLNVDQWYPFFNGANLTVYDITFLTVHSVETVEMRLTIDGVVYEMIPFSPVVGTTYRLKYALSVEVDEVFEGDVLTHERGIFFEAREVLIEARKTTAVGVFDLVVRVLYGDY